MISPDRKVLALAWIHGGFYLATGLWSIVDIDSFMFITGPKTDVWLVRTVGLLVAVTGAALLRAAHRRSLSSDLVMIAVGQAVVLMVVDVLYVSLGRIDPIYLADAVLELGLAAGWVGVSTGRAGASAKAS